MNPFIRFTGLCLLVAVAAAGAGCKRNGLASSVASPDPPTAPAAGVVAGTRPQFHFETTLVEISVAPDAKSTVADFAFTNKTGQTIIIDRVEKTCTCVSVQVSGGKLSYAPGEKGVIRATFELDNLTGEVEKSVALYLAGDVEDQPTHTLTARVLIPVLVKMTEKTLKWTVGGQPEPQKIGIEMDYTKPIRVLSAQSSSENIKTEVKTLEEGKRYELWVTPVKAMEPGLALIRVETDCDIARHKVQQVFAVIRVAPAGEGGAAAP